MNENELTYVKVTNKIVEINSHHVTFDNGSGSITSIARRYKKSILWKLKRDGIYVEKQYAISYGLTVELTVDI